MIIAVLVILGLIWGSFVGALVWRMHEMDTLASKKPKKSGKSAKNGALDSKHLSMWRGRSMCPNCHHELKARDLVPLLSWLALHGKCRYCKMPISVQYPLMEIILAAVFVLSYIFWPVALISATSWVIFGLWLAMAVILLALAVYDLKWRLLPDKLVIALAVPALAQAVISIISADDPVKTLINYVIAVAIGGGLFLIIILINNKWIGGGDVKLGFVLGLIAATPAKSVLLIFLAALLGVAMSLPLVMNKKLNVKSAVSFGPYLIVATTVTVVFGQSIVEWYFRLINLS